MKMRQCIGNATDICVVWENLDIGDGEDADGVVPLPLVPVVVHLLLDVDNISLPETQLTIVLGLKFVHLDCLYNTTLIIIITWKLKSALATFLQSVGFFPALRNRAWLPFVSCSSYLNKYCKIPIRINVLFLTCSVELEISDLVTKCRDVCGTPDLLSVVSPCAGQCSCRTCPAASSASS